MEKITFEVFFKIQFSQVSMINKCAQFSFLIALFSPLKLICFQSFIIIISNLGFFSSSTSFYFMIF
jgi:hypothetical protein